MTRSHPPFQYMRQFKAVAMDYEYYLSLLDEGQLYCLTERQIYILLVQLEYVGWLTRWYNTDDVTQTTVELIKSDLMEALMSCVDISILVDQAKLNLVDSVTHNQIESQALRDILEDRYIPDDPTSINPSAPTTNFGSTGDRFDALCAGLTAFVYQFARAQADSARAAQVGGLLSVALIAALLIPGLNFFFVVGASIAVALGLGTIGVSLETAIAALTDKTALDAVICFMRDTLKDQSVNESNWGSCLDAYPFGVGTHEAIICDFIKATLAQNYLTILNILGQAYDGTINGDAMPDCPCEPESLWIQLYPYGTVTQNSGPTDGSNGHYSFTFTSEQVASADDQWWSWWVWRNKSKKLVVTSVTNNQFAEGVPDGGKGTFATYIPGNGATEASPLLGVTFTMPITTGEYGGFWCTTYAPYENTYTVEFDLEDI